MSIGWFADLADADAYFADERLETDAWDALDDDPSIDKKTKVINQAYNRLYHDPKWVLPTYADATVAELVKLRIANAEMAYYLAVHLMAEDHRMGIQAQNVIEAGVVKEKYSEDKLNSLPVPAAVEALLEPWLDTSGYIAAANLARDEEVSVREKVHDF